MSPNPSKYNNIATAVSNYCDVMRCEVTGLPAL